MKIEIVPLTQENLNDAPEWDTHPYSCKYCIYWEFPEEAIDPAKELQKDMFKRKVNWLQNTAKKFGTCGIIAYVDGKPAGYAQYAPPEFLPQSARYPSGPVSSDAVLISCLFIPNREFRGVGLGSQILTFIVENLRKRGVKAVETFARKSNPANPSGPVEFYLKHGFRISKDDREFPLMRLKL